MGFKLFTNVLSWQMSDRVSVEVVISDGITCACWSWPGSPLHHPGTLLSGHSPIEAQLSPVEGNERSSDAVLKGLAKIAQLDVDYTL